MDKKITIENLNNFSENFNKDRANIIAMNSVFKNGISASAQRFDVEKNNQNAFSVTVESGKVCDQKHSGRCWMFASLNVMRLEIMKKLNIENMELSQAYPLFFDKLEKSNYFLENILETLDEETNGRIVSFLLQDPLCDGGQWDMFRSIIEKYGIVPKEVYPESFSSSNTTDLDTYLTTKLREYACTIRKEYKNGKDVNYLRGLKEEMLNTVYRMLTISLGEPPKSFSWETYDKDKKFIKVENITPKEFYDKYIGFNLDNLVSIINAPTEDKPYGKTYTVKFLGTVKEGKYPVKYLNLPMKDLKDIAIRQLKDNQTVWFGSDVCQFSSRKSGYLTHDELDIEGLFNTTFPLTKAERLEYGESLMTHAMVITGVDLDENGNPIKWKVENSWGDDVGKKGYYVMSDKWFEEFAYQILLDRKYLSEEQKNQFDTEPIVLEPWDPMGSLA